MLMLRRPARLTIFRVDQHDDTASKQSLVVLYKEFRYKGTVRSGSGIFKSSRASPANYSLVFQGSSNMRDSPADFTHWRLEIKGIRASYPFFC